jgi:uncharacterized protein (DUF2147 family)
MNSKLLTAKALLCFVLCLACLSAATVCVAQTQPEDAILGKWMSVEETLEIEVYKDHNDFKSKIIWFRDHDNTKRPMAERQDTENPNKALRSRKIIGSETVRNLKYNAKEKRWEDGIIYDATSGKEWQSVAWVTPEGQLKVRGYWHFEIFGKTLVFRRAT